MWLKYARVACASLIVSTDLWPQRCLLFWICVQCSCLKQFRCLRMSYEACGAPPLRAILFFDCWMLGRTSLQHGMVFHEDADPKMIGHQRSSMHGPALSPYRRKFSPSKKVWHNVPRRSHSAHPRQGNHTDARQTQAPSKLSLKKVPKKFPTHSARRGKDVCVPLHSDKSPARSSKI